MAEHVAPLTIAECDRRLMACWRAYLDADLIGDTESADAAYDLLNGLLEQRQHLPLRASVIDRLLAPKATT